MKQLKGLEEFKKVTKKWKHSSFLCKLRKQNNYMITFLLLGVLFLAVLTLFFIFFFALRVDIRVLLPHFFFFRFFFFCLFFFSFWVFIHEHSRFIGQQLKEEELLSATSTRFTDTQTLAGWLLQRTHLRI